LHVKTGLLRFLQKTGQIGTMEKKIKKVFKEQSVLSIEGQVAPVVEGDQERFTDAIIVIVMGVVQILKTQDMKDIVQPFALHDIHSFVQASNVENQAAIAISRPSMLRKTTTHLMISSPKLYQL